MLEKALLSKLMIGRMMQKRLEPHEIEYIKQNCLLKSDEEMAEHLKRDLRTIVRNRRKVGINKRNAGKVVKKNLDPYSEVALHASKTLNEDQRKSFFKTQLTNSLYYDSLKSQFTKDEVDFYLEEWASLCVQFEDIVATEKRQIDEFIKTEILDNRILRNIKITEEAILSMQHEIIEFRQKNDMTDEEVQERDMQLMSMVRAMSSQCGAMSKDHDKLSETKGKLLNQLNARRVDRIDQLKRAGTTFIGLVTLLKDRKVREDQGRYIELMKLAKDKKKAEWNKPIRFDDGTMDCILLDSDSQLPKLEIVRINSRFLEEYRLTDGKNILLVEDDNRRIQFFQDVFSKNNLFYASNVDKAKTELDNNNFDLICLDYDLGLNSKGITLVRSILEDNICQNTKFLIHSMNKKGAEEMEGLLSGDRITEVFPFESILKATME